MDSKTRSCLFANICRFLLVEFQLNYILKFMSQPKKLAKALENLPSNIEEMYSNIMRRIEEAGFVVKDLALRTLSWIFHSACTRPLKMDELRNLLVTDDGDEDLDEEHQSSV